MSPAVAAMFMLFNGQNLDNWRTLSGEWAVENGSMVCAKAPASARSGYESDRYTLIFEYRGASHGRNILRTDARFDGTGGTEFLLTSYGLRRAESKDKEEDPPRSDDEWIHVHIELTPWIRANSQCQNKWLGYIDGEVPATKRGFIALSCSEKGLQIRNMKVTELGFASMFDGKTTNGWAPVGEKDPGNPDWFVKDGVLCCREQGKMWLRTQESYDNFVIRLEYWLPLDGNSGVYLHAPLEGRVSQTGQEIQLLDDAGPRWKSVKPSQRNGSVYAGIAPEKEVPAPAEQWNAIEILAQGKRICTTVNGVQLYDAGLDDASKDAQLHKHPLATRQLTGFIGLQDHTGGPKFRHLRIQRLPPASQPAKQGQ